MFSLHKLKEHIKMDGNSQKKTQIYQSSFMIVNY